MVRLKFCIRTYFSTVALLLLKGKTHFMNKIILESMMIRILTLFIFIITFSSSVLAKFVQEVELKDGTVLIGYVYRQQPSKFMVFHVDNVQKDPKSKYIKHDKDYTLQWKDVKYIRRSSDSDTLWCNDKITLKNGTTYVGQIEEQELGVSMTIRLNDTGKRVAISYNELKTSEKVAANIDKDLWLDRQYTNRLKLTDNSLHDGLIVLQYRGLKTSDCYVELLHNTGYRERIYLPDIKEYIIQLQ